MFLMHQRCTLSKVTLVLGSFNNGGRRPPISGGLVFLALGGSCRGFIDGCGFVFLRVSLAFVVVTGFLDDDGLFLGFLRFLGLLDNDDFLSL
jgi:hypothetical protein